MAGRSEPAAVDVAFERGAPTGINGVAMPILDLIGSLDIIAARARRRTAKDRDLRQAPAAVVLHAAHRALAPRPPRPSSIACATSSAANTRISCIDGLWFTPVREALDAFVDTDRASASPASSV